MKLTEEERLDIERTRFAGAIIALLIVLLLIVGVHFWVKVST